MLTMIQQQLSIIAIIFLIILDVSFSKPWNPVSFTSECGFGVPSTWLCDPENIIQDTDGNVTSQLASINNDTEGVIYWKESQKVESYFGYVIAAAVVDVVEPVHDKDSLGSITEFGEMVQQAWFGNRICDNSTLVLLSLNASQIFLFPGLGTESRLRLPHKQVCKDIEVEAANATEALVRCLENLDAALADALQPMTNAAWGYGGIVAIMFMLIFHYWIKY